MQYDHIHNIVVTGATHEAEVNNKAEQNRRHIPDEIFKCLLLNKTFSFFNRISLKFVQMF